MQIKVYLRHEQYEKWLRGEEVRVNNLPQEKNGHPEELEVKIEAWIKENELLEIEKASLQEHMGRITTYYWYTIKREDGPKAKFL